MERLNLGYRLGLPAAGKKSLSWKFASSKFLWQSSYEAYTRDDSTLASLELIMSGQESSLNRFGRIN